MTELITRWIGSKEALDFIKRRKKKIQASIFLPSSNSSCFSQHSLSSSSTAGFGGRWEHRARRFWCFQSFSGKKSYVNLIYFHNTVSGEEEKSICSLLFFLGALLSWEMEFSLVHPHHNFPHESLGEKSSAILSKCCSKSNRRALVSLVKSFSEFSLCCS